MRPSVAGFDLLQVRFVGSFLRSLGGRRLLQGGMLVLSLAIIVDGFLGPQISPVNLAGVLPWTYWRALTVVALLAAGNLFCMACPFMLPRELGRRLGLNTRTWPRALRSKWLAIGLLIFFFWAYEAFALWDKPAWTAWIMVGYFGGAFFIDALFRGASFCKYICPIGQFHFIQSIVSPLEVKVREPAVCATCRTHDCLRGNADHRGCETDLFLPTKSGNLDCTFCLDCVRACPRDNIGLRGVMPGMDLLHDRPRASLGRLSRRVDVAALALVLVSAAFASAAAMAGPVLAWTGGLAWAGTLALFLSGLLIVPALAMAAALGLGRRVAPSVTPARELWSRFSLALVPLGAAMWGAHFAFHLLAGYAAGWPVLQQAAAGAGAPIFGAPDWSMSAWRVEPNTILSLQCLLLGAGLLLTLYLGWRIAQQCTPGLPAALRLATPWAVVAIALYAVGVWIFLQPMQMRGLVPG